MPQTEDQFKDPYLEKLRASKSRSSVVQLEFITVRSTIGDVPIFVFEGGDDKIIYSQWFKRCPGAPTYEPFVCNNKGQVLALHDVLRRNLKGLSHNVLFFVDRDFDDLKGFEPSDILFMTEYYSVENYIVCAEVVEDVLKNEFPCHGLIDLRATLIGLFEKSFTEFLEHLASLNLHIYLARKTQTELRGHIPESLTQFVVIHPDAVETIDYDPAQVLPHMAPIANDRVVELRQEFDQLDRFSRHRGKFAYKFFTKWLTALADDYRSEETKFFRGIDRSKNIRQSDLVLSNLASKSPLPSGLCGFIKQCG